MIAARLAGGNLFFCLFWWGIFLVGDFWSSSEHSDFLRGFFCGGILFFGWWGVFWIVSVGKN